MSHLCMSELSPEEQKAIRDAMELLSPYLGMSKVVWTDTQEPENV